MADLIHLSQINGGTQLKTDVQSLLTSYDAKKVLTDIPTGVDTEVYTANAYLIVLKDKLAALETEIGTGGAVADQIAALKTELEATIASGDSALQTLITTINTKVIKDRVKVVAKVVPGVDSDPATLQVTGDLATLVPGIDKAQKYVVYGTDNKPLRTETGAALEYDFTNNTFTGVPSKLDTTDTANGPKYVKVTVETDVKVFPVGSFTFEQLSPDYLLDNIELNTVSYDAAIDAVVVNLAQDQQLIDEIKALVGSQAVQDQIKAITDALATRVTTVEGKIDTLNGDKDVVGSVDAKVEAIRQDLVAADAVVQASVDTLANKTFTDRTKVATKIIANPKSIQLAPEVLTALSKLTGEVPIYNTDGTRLLDNTGQPALYSIGAGVVSGTYDADVDVILFVDLEYKLSELKSDFSKGRVEEEIIARKQLEAKVDAIKTGDASAEDTFTVAADGELEFTLTQVPTASKVKVFVNGIRYAETQAFTVDRAGKKVTWTFTAANGGFDLLKDFVVTVEYAI